MRYTDALDYDDERFRRLTGVKKQRFQERLTMPAEAHARKKTGGGRPHKRQVPERLMMALEYLREYRTCFPVAARYGLAESSAQEALRRVEDTRVKSGASPCPGARR